MASNHSLPFFDLSALRQLVPVYLDEDEWDLGRRGGVEGSRYIRGDEVLHIELRKWADLLLIAPLSANTLALIALGLCPNLLVPPQHTHTQTTSIHRTAQPPSAPSPLSQPSALTSLRRRSPRYGCLCCVGGSDERRSSVGVFEADGPGSRHEYGHVAPSHHQPTPQHHTPLVQPTLHTPLPHLFPSL